MKMDKEYFMKKAVHYARLAASKGETPVGAVVVRNDEIVSIIIDKKKLPIKQITELCHITVKKIEPYRKYIIGIVIICEGQFELLKEYMPREVIEL